MAYINHLRGVQKQAALTIFLSSIMFVSVCVFALGQVNKKGQLEAKNKTQPQKIEVVLSEVQ